MSQRLRLPRGDYNYWDIDTVLRENTFLIPRKLASPPSSDGWLTVILDWGHKHPRILASDLPQRERTAIGQDACGDRGPSIPPWEPDQPGSWLFGPRSSHWSANPNS